MCTLTWLARDGGLLVVFNRDERRTRAAGLPPRALTVAGVPVLCPIDGEAGGTWIAVNAKGTVLALLNGYRYGERGAPEGVVSRGRIVLDASPAEDAGDALARLSALPLARYRPFELAAFDARGGAALGAWDGERLATRALLPADAPLVSSAFDDAGARASRRALHARTVGADPTERALHEFHASHAPERGAYSPCMHREDAATVSRTLVRVGARSVELEYRPGPPCEPSQPVRLELARALAADS